MKTDKSIEEELKYRYSGTTTNKDTENLIKTCEITNELKCEYYNEHTNNKIEIIISNRYNVSDKPDAMIKVNDKYIKLKVTDLPILIKMSVSLLREFIGKCGK